MCETQPCWYTKKIKGKQPENIRTVIPKHQNIGTSQNLNVSLVLRYDQLRHQYDTWFFSGFLTGFNQTRGLNIKQFTINKIKNNCC